MNQPINIFQSYVVPAKTPFDLEKLADRFRRRQTGWSTTEAYMCVLLAACMADGNYDPEEGQTVMATARRSRALGGLSPGDLSKLNDLVNDRLRQNPNALEEACATLPSDMCLTVFAHSVDIILSDGQLVNREAEFLNQLVVMLDIEQDHARRILEVLLLKAQY